MSMTRESLYHILANEFKQDPSLRFRCIGPRIREMAVLGNARLFDTFPCILNADAIHIFTEKMLHLLLKINTLEKTEDGLMIHESKDRKAIFALQNEIAEKACQQLLNAQGKVKKELIKLLDWEDIVDQINIPALVAAYMARVNGDIYQRLSMVFAENNEAASACMIYINRHYCHWAANAVKANEQFNTSVGVGIGLGVGILAGLSFFAGYMLTKKSDALKPDELHQNWLNT